MDGSRSTLVRSRVEFDTSTSFTAMGTSCTVRIIDDTDRHDALLQRAVAQVGHCERLWSRFRADSDVSRINAAPGQMVPVNPETAWLVAFALDAWRSTDGRFSPFGLADMAAVGYNASWSDRDRWVPDSRMHTNQCGNRSGGARDRILPSGGVDPVRVDIDRCTVGLIPERDRPIGLDLGGVAKGHTADLVLAMLLRAGVTAAVVDLGGDMALGTATVPVRMSAAVPWSVHVADPFGRTGLLATATAHGGGIATSSTLGRAWTAHDGRAVHHLIDPWTGESAMTDVVSATVVAESCRSAEVLAKLCVVMGAEAGLVRCGELGVDALVVLRDGTTAAVGDWETEEHS